MAVEDAGVETLKARDRVAVMPLVRDGREQADDVPAQGLEVRGDQDVVEPACQLTGLSRLADQGLA